MGDKLDAHILFNLTPSNDGQLSMRTYIELDINFMGLKVTKVGFLIINEPNRVQNKKHQTKHPGINQLEHDMDCIQGLCEQIWGRKY